MSGQRKLTVPILLILITGMAILVVLLLSKMLLNNQALSTDKGIRLAEQYESCQAFASTLESGSKALSETSAAVDRLPVMAQLGQLQPLEAGCAEVLSRKAVNAAIDEEQTKQAILADLAAIRAKATGIGGHDGALNADEKAAADKLQAGGASLVGILKQYSVPSEDDRYRQMAAGVDWTKPAAEAADQIRTLAGSLSS